MKIKPEHYKYMKEKIDAIPEEDKQKHFEFLKTDPRVKDINKRFRWDLSNYAGLTPYICNNIYAYANDDHIDTALKRIVPERR